MSIHNKPSVRQIQPMGFSGRLEAIRAPTIGKARKGTKISRALTIPPVPQVLGTCADRAATYSATLAKNMASDKPASDQASQAAVRRLIPRFLDPVQLPFLSQHYSKGLPSLNRYDKRYDRTPCESLSPTPW